MKTVCLLSRRYKHDLISIAILFSILISLLIVGPSVSTIRNRSGTITKSKISNSSTIENNNINLLNSDVIETSNESERSNSKDFVYLSDIPYMPGISYTSYSSIQLDKNLSGGLISLIVDGKKKYFMKGIFAHANATLAYDLSGYDYDYLTTYLGVDSSVGSAGNGVRFEIHTSDDGTNWTLQERINNNAVFKGNSEAYFFKYPVKGVKYIKFVVQDHGGNNSSDHSVFANAKLINEGYVEETVSRVDYIKTVEEYDEIIKGFSSSELSREQELTLLQRNFVNNVGYDLLLNLVTFDANYNNAIRWLMTDLENLKLYTTGGKPSGTYYNSVKVLTELYKTYKDDFNVTEVSRYGNKKGDVYKRMAITLSLTHSASVHLWMPSSPGYGSDAVTRYAIYKLLYDNDKLVVSSKLDVTKWFESYTIEEMRFVMNNIIDDESILWLHDYTQSYLDKSNGAGKYLTPHPYIAYVWPNYGNAIFHDPNKKDYWDQKFGGIFSEYGVSYSEPGRKVYRVWMNFRNEYGTGAVCGGISKSGSNIRAVHGIPSTVIGQPGHAALLFYTQTADGKGYWGIDNDVSGWTKSEKGERMLLGWGNDKRYTGGYSVSYMVMAQEALNRFERYEKSVEMIMLADLYPNDLVKREEYLWKALDSLDFNADAWYALIDLYKKDSSKTEEDFYNLAKRMSDALMYYPLPYYHLMAQIKPKMSSVAGQFQYSLLLTNTLTKGKSYTGNAVLQPGVTRTMASYLLGQTDTSLAKFSFDGDDAENIVLSSRFDGSGIRWDYSLDGKNTWNDVSFTSEEVHKLQLSKEQIASITAENDIYIHIVGTDYSDGNIFKIDILESTGLPSTLYANDLENRFIGAIPTIKWKYENSDVWISYKDELPNLNGDVNITLKAGATGVYLESKEEKNYTFTTNTDTDERKYISIDNLTLHSVSSEATSQKRYARNVIDGNINTSWHSDWNGNDKTKEIVIKFNEPRNLTAFEYIPAAGGNGKIESAQILVSMDGENWNEVVSGTDWTYKSTSDVSPKSVDFPAVKAEYVKVVGKRTQPIGSSKSFITGTMFNFYENTSIKIRGSFSFDGVNAHKIVLDKESYNGLSWRYSLDSGNTWTNAIGEAHTLTNDEIESINEENQIILMFTGDSKQYTLPIKKADAPARATYLNDLENLLIGVSNIEKLEWKIKDTNDKWKSYSDQEPVVSGNKTLLVRTKAAGVTQASEAIEYEFTDDDDDESRRYIPKEHLSIHGYSTQSIDTGRPFYAPNAIDGNPATLWHTDFRYDVRTQDVKPYLEIKLDKPRNISGLDFLQTKYKVNDPDYIKNAIVYVSEDGENWVEAGRVENLPKDASMKTVTFDESIYAHYVKLEMDTYDIFASVSMLNLYEDVTKELPTVTVEYSTEEVTNQPVIATVVSDKEITVINNGGSDTYTFEENGSFAFEYVDSSGNTGTAIAVVDYIDTTAPVGTIDYSIRDITNQDVVVTLTTDKETTILNNDGSNTYTFTENGDYEFEFIDLAGNKGTATASVTWINKNAPTGTLTYSKLEATNQDVVVTLTADRKITITNNNGLNTYTFEENGEFVFEFVDGAGNKGSATAVVTWINKKTPTVDVRYSTTKATKEPVVVTLVNSSTQITITNNNGSGTYTFTKNGTFTFEFVDNAGNKGTKTVTVDWIKDKDDSGDKPSDEDPDDEDPGDEEDPEPSDAKVELVYDITTLTNQDVTVTLKSDKKVTITNNNGDSTYKFKDNGSFTFEYVDESERRGTVVATVDWIDKVAPKGTIKYDISVETENSVTATLGFDEEVTITNNGGSNSYTFTHNGIFTFEFVDKAGNKGSAVAKVDWIVNPNLFGKLVYSESSATNKDVVVTLQVNDGIRILNNSGSNTYTFKENGKFDFIIADEYGNKKTVTATVVWIDKDSPIGTVSYDLTTPTNGKVIATLKTNEDVTVLNNKGSKTYVFTDNGKFVFEFVDKAGNKGSAEAIVDWIDKEAPIGNVTFNVKDLTNKDVTATLIVEDGVTITNNDGSNTYVFKENGIFVFEFVDELGNKGSSSAIVDWIDKVAPVGEITYSITNPTYESIIVTLKTNEDVTVLNNSGKFTYVFTKNGKFTFEFVDKAGNKGFATATVSWITEDVVDPKPPVEPSKPEEPVVPEIPVTPVEPSVPSVSDETSKQPQTGTSTNTKPSNKPNGGSSIVSNTNTGTNNTTTTTNNQNTTTPTTSNVEEDETTTTSAKNDKDHVEIKVPQDEDNDEDINSMLNYKIIIGCLIVFIFFVATLVSLYIRR